MLADLPRPTVFAHRGASLYAPENTLPAFRLAVEQGAPAIELDVKLSADGEVVVVHDLTVDRTTDGSGRVSDMTLSELQQLRADRSGEFPEARIPALIEVLEELAGRVALNIELTNYGSPTDELPAKVADLLELTHTAHRVLISSFNSLALIRMRRRLPQIPIGLLADAGRRGALARGLLARVLRCQALHPYHEDVTPALVERVHREGRLLNTYTVNSAERMRFLLDLKVDGWFTDDPPLALALLRAPADAPAPKTSRMH